MPLESFNTEDTINACLEPEFNFAKIEALKTPIENILAELKDEINAGNYKMVLGDDASGRIPADIFGKVLKSIYKENNFEVPQVRFVLAHYDIDKKFLDKKMKRFKKEVDIGKSSKILIITDTIVTGAHLRPVVDKLKENNINFDIATIGAADIDNIDILRKEWNCTIVVGIEGTPEIYSDRFLSGVYKEQGDVISKSYKKFKINNKVQKKAQHSINDARQDVDKLSLEVFEWYKQKQKDAEGDKN
ncbi:hypothetical protein A2W54_00240 [Candidatus Giovannonibacteria bacterium RIFCSPHIGHO2_02_43_13]|uniref:Phosphoribosyltransferase domain-containing protein n=1 Tax=Candidatus Giovannonibacteria bacterium RIFCSPHIGHO2_02_43_13 TaxID=1798330 RepID=A0A1F5WPP3_9BACT|nr:MAG: hypothetical protein UW28_C0005G0019 [Parcubacteria group bacterium GW2011_GWA2_44_13]OGF72375.1 MAG: hypothetical protein A3E06_02495 [Candidatus Giovannonibacteria bacterium RIFCSPHIGHO2_12_FULL_44_42]OGF77628.1 MAG: hypothetical protein A2W54_00240 [Candidatus Giovannonibacteria bacterium RIFCSPHIGHO2_02_43_13]OGF89196.1 MAG: hypothetical protein A3I94_00605 [Candidatus Giovannonibacteria bacterium RIFCSPLOWO2_02_FULL_43_54]OGF97017.1 MAG: hypothetical protein A3H08_03795 [Candidatus